jgi:pentatricopeptide repeat protein
VSADDDKYLEAMRRFSGDLRMTRQVFESMIQREVEITEAHWRLLLSANLDARDLVGAREVVERMRSAGVEPDASVRWDLAIATSRSGRTDEALALLDQLHEEGQEPDAEHAPAVLGIYVTAAASRLPGRCCVRWPAGTRPRPPSTTSASSRTACRAVPSRTPARSST